MSQKTHFWAAFQAGSEVWGANIQGRAGLVALGMGVHTGLMSGYLHLPTGVSGGRRLAGAAAQLGQEGLRVCSGKERMGHPYPSSTPPCGQETWGQRAEIGRAAGAAVLVGGTHLGWGLWT